MFDSHLPDRSVFSFLGDNLSKCGFPPEFVCALILGRSDLGLLMGKFFQFLTELFALFLFWDDNLRKYQWIFTKPGMCIDIVEICLRFLMGNFINLLTRVICPQHDSVLLFRVFI